MRGGRGDGGHFAAPAVIKAYWLCLTVSTVLAGGLASLAVDPVWAQTITIPSGASLVVTGLTTNAGDVITNAGTVTVSTGSTLDNSGTVANNGTFNADVNNTGAAALITNNANATWNGNLLSNTGGATVTNGGTWNGDANNASIVTNSGTWTTTSAGFTNSGTLTTTGTLDGTNGGLTNTGTVNAAGVIDGVITNNGAGTFTVTGNLV